MGFLVDEVQVEHASQDIIATHSRIRGASNRIIFGRCGQNARQSSGFSFIDIRQIFAEVNLCCCGYTVRSLTEKHLVDEERHNFALGKFLLDLVSKESFTHFPSKHLLAGQKIIAGELLCQRTAAPADAAGNQESETSPENSLVIDAGVLKETAVFCGDESINHMLRDFIVSDEESTSLADFFNETAIPTENSQRNLQRNVTNRFSGR